MIKKIISLFLGLLLLTTCLTACSLGSEKATDETTAAETADPVPEAYEISVEELSNYIIVYSANATADVEAAATTLSAAFANKFGVALKARADDFINMSGELVVGEYEILIGETNREESAAFLSTLKYKDSGYKLMGKKLVIAAHDFYSTAQAVTDFVNLIRKTDKNATVFYRSEMDKTAAGSYRYGTMTLDGADIAQYSIVYPEGAAFEKMLANKLMKSIAEHCGSVLAVVSDAEEIGGRAILVGRTRRGEGLDALNPADGGPLAVLYGGDLHLCGGDALGHSQAVDAFRGLYEQGEAADILALDLSGIGGGDK